KQRLSEEERRCHQIFRLTASDKDVSYEWYKNRIENRVEGTCHWFLNHSNFRHWLEQASGPLLVSADPGCGKSVLAKYLVDHALPQAAPDACICYFFFKDQNQNTVRQTLCALLHQLFSHNPLLIRYAMGKYEKDGPGLVNTTPSLWAILENSLRDPEAGSMIFVLDALDECLDHEFRYLARRLKELHRELSQQSRGRMRSLLTCCPYEGIVGEFRDLCDEFPYIRIPGEDESHAISSEVNLVIAHRVEELARKQQLPQNLKDMLRNRLLEVNHRTYLWVYLVFDHLRESVFKKTEKAVMAIIATLPESVNQAYEKILNNIILAASRPLALMEMNVAVNVLIDDDGSIHKLEDLDLEDEDDFASCLRSWCGLFVSVYHGKLYFLHQTAREFLLADPSQSLNPRSPLGSGMQWHKSITARDAHAVLARVCVAYL
ncbi:uncharacterized protein B0T15DRAFT_376886, partial [Chaetomium strumarium]